MQRSKYAAGHRGRGSVTSGSDGIHAENADDAAKGFLCIAGGSFTIDARGDAISASGQLQIDGGSYALTAGGGSESATMKAGDTMQRPGFRDFSAIGASPDAAAAEDTVSCKGIKADGTVVAVGKIDYCQRNVSSWTGIKSPK